MITYQDKKNDKVMEAGEKYSLNVIKNAALSTIKKNDTKEERSINVTSRKRSSYGNW